MKEQDRRGVSPSAIARTLQVTEGAVRYHLRRQTRGDVKENFRRIGVWTR